MTRAFSAYIVSSFSSINRYRGSGLLTALVRGYLRCMLAEADVEGWRMPASASLSTLSVIWMGDSFLVMKGAAVPAYSLVKL